LISLQQTAAILKFYFRFLSSPRSICCHRHIGRHHFTKLRTNGSSLSAAQLWWHIDVSRWRQSAMLVSSVV